MNGYVTYQKSQRAPGPKQSVPKSLRLTDKRADPSFEDDLFDNEQPGLEPFDTSDLVTTHVGQTLKFGRGSPEQVRNSKYNYGI